MYSAYKLNKQGDNIQPCCTSVLTWTQYVVPCPVLTVVSISLHWSLRKAFLSLLALLWNSAFKCFYLSFSPLLFTSLLFIAICKASSDSHLAFLHFFFLGMILIPVSCTMSWTSVHSSSGTLSIRFSSLNLFLTCSVKCQAGWSTSWNQECQEKYQSPQICRWPHPYGRKQRTKEPLDESERGEWKTWLKAQHSEN